MASSSDPAGTDAVPTVEQIWRDIAQNQVTVETADAIYDRLVGPDANEGSDDRFDAGFDQRRQFVRAVKGIAKRKVASEQVALSLLLDVDGIDQADKRYEAVVRDAGENKAIYLRTKAALFAPIRPRVAINAYARLTALAPGDVDAHHAIARLLEVSGDLADAERWYVRTLALPELERGTRAIVMTELASLTGRQGRLEDAYAWREHAFRLYEETDNKIGALMQIVHLAANARERGETALLESWVEAYVEAQLELGEPQAAAPALEELVTLALDCDDQSLAEARAHRALALYEKLGDEGGGARELTNLSALAAKRKDFGAAEQLATEALAVDTRLEAPEQITDLLRRLRTVSELHRRAKG